MTFFFCVPVLFGRGRKEGTKEGRKERRKEGTKERRKEGNKGRKEGRNETRRYPPFFTTKLGLFFFRFLYISSIVILLLYICFDVNLLNYLTLGFFSPCCLVLHKFMFTLGKVIKSDNLVGMRPV